MGLKKTMCKYRKVSRTVISSTKEIKVGKILKKPILTSPDLKLGTLIANTTFTLLYHHLHTLFTAININKSTNDNRITVALSMLVADLVLAFMWFTHQNISLVSHQPPGFSWKSCQRWKQISKPWRVHLHGWSLQEPPVNVMNAALSVMAYEYSKSKLSVYVLDDGGSP